MRTVTQLNRPGTSTSTVFVEVECGPIASYAGLYIFGVLTRNAEFAENKSQPAPKISI